jgi:hypothetical protein
MKSWTNWRVGTSADKSEACPNPSLSAMPHFRAVEGLDVKDISSVPKSACVIGRFCRKSNLISTMSMQQRSAKFQSTSMYIEQPFFAQEIPGE